MFSCQNNTWYVKIHSQNRDILEYLWRKDLARRHRENRCRKTLLRNSRRDGSERNSEFALKRSATHNLKYSIRCAMCAMDRGSQCWCESSEPHLCVDARTLNSPFGRWSSGLDHPTNTNLIALLHRPSHYWAVNPTIKGISHYWN